MSLKAKIEAVIYASEEPVTLVQLAGLLGHEAQAELDHIASAQQSLTLDDPFEVPADPEDLNNEILVEPEEAPEASHEALDKALHEAAAEEAREAKIEARHNAADDAAMSSADVETPVEAEAPLAEEPEAVAEPEVQAEEVVDEKKLAREAKEKERRLREYFRALLDELIADYANSDRGLEIREVAGGYRLATKPEYHDAVRGFVKSLKPPLKLSLQALETLAVVAYKQPVTAPEISEIRGVDSGGVLGSLMTRKLITTAGRKQVIGRPILYKTTRDFLLRFGLKDINELPSIEEFEKMAGELADAEPVQEEIPMAHEPHEMAESVTEANLEEERASIEPQADGDGSDLDTVPVDGRISGPPPAYDEAGTAGETDSPALDAEIQGDAQLDDPDKE
ncbi:SMC-Scp complex subunit ScpB [Granulicella arctica]|uniref:Segregation and condensation protein B n=1 Tax=Granulicella arctica TaxID=940613 RepID=A0A7Y9PHC9_9BACT|nr:SMC-Scp complex subunit ScpB [Granulicella arctica]NYF79206.1 segregation and condensation protein B [Granulicella arctica]